MVCGPDPNLQTGITDDSPGWQTPRTRRHGLIWGAANPGFGTMAGWDDPVLSVVSYTLDGVGLKRRELVDGVATTLIWDGADTIMEKK